jgi:hypothetical protein
MSTNVGAVPVMIVWKKEDARLICFEDLTDDFDACAPVLWIMISAYRDDAFEAARPCGCEFESNIAAGILQFAQTALPGAPFCCPE